MWWRSPLPRLPRSHPFVDFLRSDSASRHILECGDPGVWPMTPSFELGRNFGTLHLTAKFYHPTFNRSEVIMLTNKLTNRQTPLKTPTSLRYATPVGNNILQYPHGHLLLLLSPKADTPSSWSAVWRYCMLLLKDLDFVRYIITCLTTYFPGMLAYILLFEMPWLLSCMSRYNVLSHYCDHDLPLNYWCW